MANNQNTHNMMLEPASIVRLEREPRLYEKLADKILELVSTGTWKPGFRLPPERELSEAFGVSRTVVREAVKALEARGVLESVTGGGVSVRLADSDIVSRSLQTYMRLSNRVDFEIRLNEVRRVLEVELVALAAARRTSEQLEKLHQICKQMRASDDSRISCSRHFGSSLTAPRRRWTDHAGTLVFATRQWRAPSRHC